MYVLPFTTAAGGDRSGPAISSISSNIMRKRNYEQTGGSSESGPANKRLIMAPQRHPGKRGRPDDLIFV